MDIMTLVAGGVGLIALTTAGALLLPRHVHVKRQATLDAAPSAVLALASSNEGYQRFNPYRSTDPALKIAPFGPVSGVGSGFAFEGKDGKGKQTVAAVGPDSVRYDIDMGAMGQPRQAITAVPDGGGSRVTWTMDMDLGFNPLARVFGLFMDRMVGKTFEKGLDNLAAAT